ncbi:MAG: imelysin family protein [Rhodobacteraceae bacterium]|nr:imelysin family protein [Paracoccaceae bacterium]
MFRLTALAFGAALMTVTMAPADAPDLPEGSYHPETGLPYWAPGRGEVDHDAVRRRALEVLERQFGAFRDASAALSDTAAATCTSQSDTEALKDQLAATWIAWAPLDSYQFGPIQTLGAALSVNFWPDAKNYVGRGLAALLAEPADRQADPAVVMAGSAAAQGLPALEMLLYSDLPVCPAAQGIAAALAQQGQTLYDAWFAPDGWADIARAAGPDNPVYQNAAEFTKTLYTAVDFGLIRVEDARLGRPLGTFDRPFPTRAEAWRSGLSADIIHAQLSGAAEMIERGFAGDIREPDRSWILQVIDQAHARLDTVGQPIYDAVQDPTARFRVEALKQKIEYLRDELARDIGPNLGVDTGFSAADGD